MICLNKFLIVTNNGKSPPILDKALAEIAREKGFRIKKLKDLNTTLVYSNKKCIYEDEKRIIVVEGILLENFSEMNGHHF